MRGGSLAAEATNGRLSASSCPREGIARGRSQTSTSVRGAVARWAPVSVLVAAMAIYAGWFTFWSIIRFDAFQAPGFDLGIYDQGLWLLSHFKEPFITVLGLNLFGDHASFIVALLVPLYWVAPYAETLLVVQCVVLALGAIPAYLLGRMVLRNRWFALVPAIAYLLTPALGWLNLENFHPDCFAVPLLLSALYFMARSRWVPFFVMVVLLLTVKEDVPLVLVPLGIYIAIRHDRRVGIVTTTVSLCWFFLVMFVIQPALSGAAAGQLDSWRLPFGGLGGLAATAIKRPWEVAGWMLTADKVKYLFQLFTPLLFLPLLTWRTMAAVPVLAFNLVSTFWYQSNLQYHYTSLVIPVLCGAALLALERFRSLQTRRVLAVAMLLATVGSVYLWGPVPKSREAAYVPDPSHPQAVACAEAVARIRDDAIVAAGDKVASHLTHRVHIYVFPTPFSAAYWGDDSQKGQRLPIADDVEYVLDLPGMLPEESVEVIYRLESEGFVAVFEEAGVVLLERTVGPAGCGGGGAGP